MITIYLAYVSIISIALPQRSKLKKLLLFKNVSAIIVLLDYYIEPLKLLERKPNNTV